MKTDEKIRMKRIVLGNIKNVIYGSVSLDEVDEDSGGASVIGIYGQNGSGKTSLICALDLCKNLVSGKTLPEDTYYYINQTNEKCCIQYELLVQVDGRDYNIFYTISLRKTSGNGFEIADEILEYSASAFCDFPKINKTQIISVKNISSDNEEKCCYTPNTRISELMSFDKTIKQKLVVQQVVSRERRISYIFNDRILSLPFKNELFNKILNRLKYYFTMNFFVLNKNSETSFNINLLPLSVRIESDNHIMKSDSFAVGLGKNSVTEKTFDVIKIIVTHINSLLTSVIPGMIVEFANVENSLNEKAEKCVSFELVSNRRGIKTPLRYESEGIKKILCVLSSLIAMFNNDSIFVAIDELDAGIFEYLLGEMLRTINENGKGQLLFTSHNMRPLEVLNNNNIYFSTVNPENKYIQFTGIKSNNNLRSILLRTIDLGGQKEKIYDGESTYKMAKAFRKSGEVN